MTTEKNYDRSDAFSLSTPTHLHLKLVYDASNRQHQGKGRLPHTGIGPRPVAVSPALVMGTVMAIVLVGVVYLFGANVRERMVVDAIEGTGCKTVHVAPGDDLWSIANQNGVEGVSTYDVVHWIKEQNHISASALTPGLELKVPGNDS